MTTARTRVFWLLLAMLALMAFAFQGTRGIWEPDEGRYSSAGINMLRGGDWMVPSIDAEHPHLTKPPLTYWALAASFGLLGANEWAARLPGALAFVGTGLFVFGLGRRLCAPKPWLPTVVWSLSLGPLMAANVVSTDAVLMLFETAAMFAFVEAWMRPPPERRIWTRIMWLAWGLAFLTKGPPGLLPLFAMFAWLAAHERDRLRGLLDPLGLLLFALTAFSWFGAVIAQDPARLQYFLGYEVYDRVFTDTHHRHAEWYGGLTVYLPVLLVGSLPWWPFAVRAAGGFGAAWATLRERVRSRDPQWLLLLYWMCVPLAIFMLARSRLPLYVLSLFVPLALMTARPLARWPWLTAARLRNVAVLAAIALLACKGVLAHWHSERDSRAAARQIVRMIDPQEFDGITFVDMRPFYGLNVYLGRPVKAVPMTTESVSPASASAFAAGEDLCSELARDRRALLAVKSGRVEELGPAVVRCGRAPPREVGRFRADGNTIVLFALSPTNAVP
jgi:4-amino-4-deoxy-L-arabinose transferase-like glycosyltransferase